MGKKTPQEFDIEGIELISVKQIFPSTENNRDDKTKNLQSLADSIKSEGLLNPIIVRVHPKKKDSYELLCGERRWRAFRLLKYESIPTKIMNVDDHGAKVIRQIENMQRENLSFLEEAAGVKSLLETGLDKVDVAARLGKTVAWVVRRAKTLDLSAGWKKQIAITDGDFAHWTAAHFELIARYDQATQDDLLESLQYRGDISAKDLESYLAEQQLALSSAPWKTRDELLLPAAGACSECQKRTSCAPDLFEAIDPNAKPKNGDQCLDRKCWGSKLAAYHETSFAKANEQHSEMVVVDKSDYNGGLLDRDHTLKKSAIASYKFEPAKKTDEGAIPAYVIDGPGAGKITYVKPHESFNGESKPARQVGEDGKLLPKSLEERQEGLLKRRVIRLIGKIIELLQGLKVADIGEDPESEKYDHDKEQFSKIAGRMAIAENLSAVEVFKLVYAFGAGAGIWEFGHDHESEPQQIAKLSEKNPDAVNLKNIAAVCVFPRIIDKLRLMAAAQKVDLEYVEDVCRLLHLDQPALWQMVLDEIPEPKSWAKLKTTNDKNVAEQIGADVSADHYAADIGTDSGDGAPPDAL